MNFAVVLAMAAGVAVALQVVVNSIGLRDLGIGSLIGFSGATTAVAGFAVAYLTSSVPEITARATLCGLASGLLGAFIVAAIVLAAGRTGLAQTLSLVIASQLLLGLLVDRAGLLGPAVQEVGLVKVLGVLLVLAGGILVVRF